MADSPVNQYKIDDLCSISIGKTILEVTLQPGFFEVADIEKVLQKLDEYVGEKELRVLINCVPGSRTSIAGVRTLAKASSLKYATAKAYVIHTLHHRLMANIYLLLVKPTKPIRFFRDADRARKWLNDLVIM